uniref:Uncharacterized protein n=1 Tax=Amphimedon queenslandica TaxID=400682 RepID=A0A1X7VL25_AMPQE
MAVWWLIQLYIRGPPPRDGNRGGRQYLRKS